MNSTAQRFANDLADSGIEVTNVTEHADSTTVQFSIIPNPIEELYYKSVVDFSNDGFVKRYEIRLPHKDADSWTEEDARIHYKKLLGLVETSNISDWNVNIGRTQGIIAAHVESTYSEDDAPRIDELAKYVKNIHALFN